MNDQGYSLRALAVTGAVLLGSLLPKLPAAGGLGSYFSAPFYWCAVAIVIWFFMPKVHVPGNLRFKNLIPGYAFSGAVLLLALRFGAGFLLQGIALSPYNLSPAGIASNLFNSLPAFAAREMARAYALGTICRYSRRAGLWTALLVLSLCVCELNFFKMSTLRGGEAWFIYIVKDFVPLLAEGGLLTVLAYCGGSAACIVYCVSIGTFVRIFPFLPSLPWIAESALGTAFPVLFALFIWGRHREHVRTQASRKPESLSGFVAGLVLSVSFAWFTAGVFPVYPSVILTGSMEPGIKPGDVVLIRRFATEQEIYALEQNDIINFSRGDITITHRIDAVLLDQMGNVSFRTKGDNNKNADEEIVLPAALNGVVTAVVPKAGVPVLWLYAKPPALEGVFDY